MKRPNLILGLVTLALIGSTAGLLAYSRSHQQLAAPGVRTHPLPGSIRLQVEVPTNVLDYQCETLPPDEITMNILPADTSFGRGRYTAPDGFQILLSVVLMGADRTSLHKPQFCLTGDGWNIDEGASSETTIHLDRPAPYDLPVIKLIATKQAMVDGQLQTARGIYVYWYVADDALSASVSGFQRMWLMADKLLRTGVLQRWAYVSCFAVCAPGHEDATFERMKRFIAQSVPRFQMVRRAALAKASAVP